MNALAKNILIIGRDSSAALVGSPLYQRIKTYSTYHKFTFVVMNIGERKEVDINGARVVLTGGRTLVGAFFNTVFFSFKEAKRQSYHLVSTQDVLYSGIVGYLLSRIFHLPLFVQVHGDYLDNERWFQSKVGRFNKLMNGVGKFVLMRASKVRVVSERLRQELIKKYALKDSNVISIPIGTDLETFKNNYTIARKRSLLFAQRLIPEKCPILFTEVAISVLKTHPDIVVDIAGSGSLETEMRNLFQASGVLERVNFHGNVSHEILSHLYQTATVYVHTADWEGWGMPMIEAMAGGCPVVTTDTGCAGEAVRNEVTGLVTKINDKEGLINVVECLVTDQNLWNRLSSNGIEESTRWSFNELTKKHMAWYANE